MNSRVGPDRFVNNGVPTEMFFLKAHDSFRNGFPLPPAPATKRCGRSGGAAAARRRRRRGGGAAAARLARMCCVRCCGAPASRRWCAGAGAVFAVAVGCGVMSGLSRGIVDAAVDTAVDAYLAIDSPAAPGCADAFDLI